MITSTSSSQVKHIVNLQKKSKLRKEEKQFVVEGIKMVSEAPKDRLVKVYISETFKADNEEFLKKMNYEAVGKDVLEIVSDNVFVRMSDTQTPQGIMAVVKMSDVCIEDMFEKDNYTDSKDDGADKVEDNTVDSVIPRSINQYSHIISTLHAYVTDTYLLKPSTNSLP